jgi:hypothetical protein
MARTVGVEREFNDKTPHDLTNRLGSSVLQRRKPLA